MLQSHNHIRLSLSAFTAVKSLIRNRIITKYFLFEKKPFLILSLCSCGTIIFFSTLILGLYLSWFKRMVETYGFYLIEINFSFFFFFFVFICLFCLLLCFFFAKFYPANWFLLKFENATHIFFKILLIIDYYYWFYLKTVFHSIMSNRYQGCNINCNIKLFQSVEKSFSRLFSGIIFFNIFINVIFLFLQKFELANYIDG